MVITDIIAVNILFTLLSSNHSPNARLEQHSAQPGAGNSTSWDPQPSLEMISSRLNPMK
jgi:hypothetical protein